MHNCNDDDCSKCAKRRKIEMRPKVLPAICEHGKRRCRCNHCGGVSICEHGRPRWRCKDCILTHSCTTDDCSSCAKRRKIESEHAEATAAAEAKAAAKAEKAARAAAEAAAAKAAKAEAKLAAKAEAKAAAKAERAAEAEAKKAATVLAKLLGSAAHEGAGS
jgi:hypothetical protein